MESLSRENDLRNLRLARTGVLLPYSVMPLLMGVTCMMAWLPGVLNMPFALAWFMFSDIFVKFSRVNRTNMVKVIGSLAFALNVPHVLPSFVVLALYMENMRKSNKKAAMILEIMWGIEKHFDGFMTLDTGGHGAGTFLSDFKIILSKLMLPDVQPHAVARRLRANGIDADPIIVDKKPLMEPEPCSQFVAKKQMENRWICLAIMTIVCTIYKGLLHPVMMAPFLVAMFMRPADYEEMILGKTPQRMQDGVYAIDYVYPFGLARQTAIGTVFDGVLHVPYHVVGKTPLFYGGVWVDPFYINPEMDIVTWGGFPKFSRVNDGDRLYANHEEDYTGVFNGHGTYEVEYERNANGTKISWAGQSKPGQSGSPVWKRDETGNFQLVGLVGRWVRTDGSATEFTEIPELYDNEIPDISPGNLTKINTHAGSGKSTIITPSLVGKFLNSKRGAKQCYIIGPTRTVASELYDAMLKKFPGYLGLAIHESGRSNRPTMPVQITTHSTFMTILQRNGYAHIGCVIMDEAHIGARDSIMARRFCESFASNGGSAVLMSATLDNVSNRKSNFPIEEREIETGDIEGTIDKCIAAGKKILVFLPGTGDRGTEGMTEKFASRYPDKTFVNLSRATYKSAREIVKNGEFTCVFATNIAECGFNGDFDVVVDCGTEFDYYHVSGATFGEVNGIDEASRTQRRGRVGRFKPGEYIFVKEPRTTHKTANERDAEIMMAGRKWVDCDLPNYGFQLSDNQFLKAMEYGLTPSMTRILFETNGEVRNIEVVQKIMKDELRTGGKIGTKCGKCGEGWNAFDEREHDIYHQIMEGHVVLKPYDPSAHMVKKKLPGIIRKILDKIPDNL